MAARVAAKEAKASGSGGRRVLRCAHGSYGPRDRKAAMERREAPAFSTRERGKTEDWCAARCSIPSTFEGKSLSPRRRGGTTAYPGPQRIRTMNHACCLTIKSEEGRRRRPTNKNGRDIARPFEFRLRPA